MLLPKMKNLMALGLRLRRAVSLGLRCRESFGDFVYRALDRRRFVCFSVGDGRIRLLAWDEVLPRFPVVSGNGELIGA